MRWVPEAVSGICVVAQKRFGAVGDSVTELGARITITDKIVLMTLTDDASQGSGGQGAGMRNSMAFATIDTRAAFLGSFQSLSRGKQMRSSRNWM